MKRISLALLLLPISALAQTPLEHQINPIETAGSTASFLSGAQFLRLAFRHFGHGEALSYTASSSSASAVTSSVMGAFLFMDGFALTAQARAPDHLRRLRSSAEYQELVREHGRPRAESFLADLYSGWSPERLVQKYVTPADRASVLAALHGRSPSPAFSRLECAPQEGPMSYAENVSRAGLAE